MHICHQTVMKKKTPKAVESTKLKGQMGDCCCDPDQMQRLDPKGHSVTAELLCLDSLASHPRVNI